MNKSYKEQAERIVRMFNKLPRKEFFDYEEAISEEIIDNYYNFFLHCYHFKDWIKTDSVVPQSVQNKVEDYINKNEALTYVYNIATATKHFTIKRKFKNRSTIEDITMAIVELTGGERKGKFLVVASEKTHKGFAAMCLTIEAMKAWRKFCIENNLGKIYFKVEKIIN